jgi:hypothetical protein
MPMTRDSLYGLEFDWLAFDADGHLALCSSAGYGEIPAVVLENTSEDDAWNAAESLLLTLPVIGEATAEGRGPGSCAEWPALASRGVFIFDWNHWRGPYERIVVPSVAVPRPQLARDLRRRLLVVDLPVPCFATAPHFDGGAVLTASLASP